MDSNKKEITVKNRTMKVWRHPDGYYDLQCPFGGFPKPFRVKVSVDIDFKNLGNSNDAAHDDANKLFSAMLKQIGENEYIYKWGK